ncbi:heme biosynthesis protein HemY, partial [Pseudomonas syringae pv. actinidiae]|nr:heme biosynthesis protein HemY [Pseudomonas syringae pv. actinidiae]
MKRVYVLLFIAIVAAALIGVAVAEHSGYVLIAYQNFRYESSLWATLALLVAVLLVIAILRLLITLLTTSGRVVNPWSRRNRRRRVQIAIEQGQMTCRGPWASAQRQPATRGRGRCSPCLL